MTYKLAPSLMCCDYLHLADQLKIFEQANIELLHIDIMDGNFVPNLTLGTDFAKQLKCASRIPLDFHFMTEQPEQTIEWFPIGVGDYVSIHYETTKHLQRVLQRIKDKGAKTLLALDPATPIEVARDVLDDIDGLLIMTVNPGFSGQKMIPHSIEKIARARSY
ncbi:MAG: ribulose-phosphate 3-epimerase, partial [Eubacteriales bacterium]